MKSRKYLIAAFFVAAFFNTNSTMADVSQMNITSDTLHGQINQCAISIGGAHFLNLNSPKHQLVVGSLTYMRTTEEVFGIFLKIGAYNEDKKPIPIEFAELTVLRANGTEKNTQDFKKADFGDDPNFAEYVSTNTSKDIELFADLAKGGVLKYTVKGTLQDETLVLNPPKEPKFIHEMDQCIDNISNVAISNLQNAK